METKLADFIRDTAAGQEAEDILRRCVHCGFCNATCPTYQLLGDELDGPRGRIYLIKQMLEGATPTAKTQTHLDRCLHCRSCETTCPSGVRYTRLLDIGLAALADRTPRPLTEALKRKTLSAGLSDGRLFGAALGLGRAAKPLLPNSLKERIPAKSPSGARPATTRPRRWISLEGCVQPALYPNINAAARRVLDKLGIELVSTPQAKCCGAVRQHLDDFDGARRAARANIDAWQHLLDEGAEGIVMTASGCSMHVRDYPDLLSDEPAYAHKAARIALLTRDISELIAAESAQLTPRLAACPPLPEERRRLAFHSPCSLQHGLKVLNVIEPILHAAGFFLEFSEDSHLCCGSAGAYSFFQVQISKQLRENKLHALRHNQVDIVVSANAACMSHLQSGTRTPVKHWIELIDERLDSTTHG